MGCCQIPKDEGRDITSLLLFSIDCVLQLIEAKRGSLLKVLSGANGDIMTWAEEVHKT